MRYVAAYMLAVLGGNESPSADDLKKILGSVGIDAEDANITKVIKELNGKNVEEVIAAGLFFQRLFDVSHNECSCTQICILFVGQSKLASVPSGGAVAAGGGAAAAGGEAAGEFIILSRNCSDENLSPAYRYMLTHNWFCQIF